MSGLDGASLTGALDGGLRQLGLMLEPAQRQRLLDYVALIRKWSRVYNLTALREEGEILSHHLLDSLAAVAPLRRQLQALGKEDGRGVRLLDVGAGAGLPGVVLAICFPALTVDCVDAVAKKASFIQQAAIGLELSNLRGLHARVETLSGPYDVICSRAFASLKDFTEGSRRALAEGGVWMAMKGRHPQDELGELGADFDVFHVEQLQVPGLAAERCIVWIRPRPS